MVPDGVAHHLRELARERPLPLLLALPRQCVILEHEIVRNGRRNHQEIAASGCQRGVDQPGLRRLQLAAVAAAALRIEEEIVRLQDFGDVRLQRDKIRGILRVAPDRNGAGDVPVQQAQRAAEQVDSRGDQRWPDPVVVEHERLDEVIGVALVIRRVHHAMAAHRGDDVVEVLVPAFNLAKDRIERMLQGTVNRMPLRRPQLVEVRVDALAGLRAAFAVSPAQVFDDLFTREHSLGDLVEHRVRLDYSAWHTASANSIVVAVPPRSRVRVCPAVSTRPRPDMMRSAAAASSIWRSISTADSRSPEGFARFFPAMSGALP